MLRLALPFSTLSYVLQPLEAAIPAIATWLALCGLMVWRAGKP